MTQPGVAPVALASISGVLLVLGCPPYGVSLLAWLGLAPLLVALCDGSLLAVYVRAYATGLIFFAGIFSWIWAIPGFGVLAWTLLALYLPQYVALWGLGLVWIRRRTGLPLFLVAPPLWVTFEYLRSHIGFLSLPWMLLGHSQASSPALLHITAWTGAYGLSFLVVLANAAIVDTLTAVRGRRTPLAVARAAVPILAATVVVASLALWGFATISGEVRAEHLTVAAVHGDIPLSSKWEGTRRSAIIARHVELTLESASQAPALIIWPETAVPGDLASSSQPAHLIGGLARQMHSYLLVGNSERAKFSNTRLAGRFYNTLVLIAPDGRVADEYRKVRLVPFGEYEPLPGVIPWPRALVPVRGAMVAGDRHTLFRIGPAAFGAAICWESIFPDLFRSFVQRGARFMVSATNEAWFANTGAAEQFLAITVLRAAENRTPIVRSSNLGVSAFIDSFGQIAQRWPDPARAGGDQGAVLVGAVPLGVTGTFYTWHGDVFAWVALGVSIVLACAPALGVRWRPIARRIGRPPRSPVEEVDPSGLGDDMPGSSG
jgi:apolipoprotein N-acyltransferase